MFLFGAGCEGEIAWFIYQISSPDFRKRKMKCKVDLLGPETACFLRSDSHCSVLGSYCGFLPLSAFNDQYGCWSLSAGPGNLGTNFQESSIPSVQILTVHILVIQTPEVCSTEHSRCAGRSPQLGLPSCSSLIWLVLYLLTHLQMPSAAKRTLISLKLQGNSVNLWLLSLPSLLLSSLLLLSQCLKMKPSHIRQMF